MIISRAEVESAAAAYRTGIKRTASSVPVSVDVVDAFTPTENVALISAMRDRIVGAPYYRERLVGELKRRIQEGRYFVQSEEIVEKMIGRLIVESVSASPN